MSLGFLLPHGWVFYFSLTNPGAVVLNLPNFVTFNIALYVVKTPNHKIILLLLHNCDFATVLCLDPET